MIFNKELLEAAVLNGTVGKTIDSIELIESGDWISDGKYDLIRYVFKFDGRFYQLDDSRSGSYHTDYYYESSDWCDRVECDEVESRIVERYEWIKVK